MSPQAGITLSSIIRIFGSNPPPVFGDVAEPAVAMQGGAIFARLCRIEPKLPQWIRFPTAAAFRSNDHRGVGRQIDRPFPFTSVPGQSVRSAALSQSAVSGF
jgi:hypothetical protein